MRASILDPPSELFTRGHGTGRVVGETQVNQVDMLCGDRGHEVVLCSRWDIDQPGKPPSLVGRSRAPRHDVGIDINRVDRVGDGDFVVGPENLQDVSSIAFRAVRNEHLVGLDRRAARCKIVRYDRISQKIIALFGAISAKCRTHGHFVDRIVPRLDNGARQRFGDVANSQANDLRLRMIGAEFGDAPADLGKQISGFQFAIVFVVQCEPAALG